MKKKFIIEWKRVQRGNKLNKENISPIVIDLVFSVYEEVSNPIINLYRLRGELIKLLEYLCSSEGRTNENIRAVDLFFCIGNGWRWGNLPEEYINIMKDIGGSMHDTISNPQIAGNFSSLPEQLLERVKHIPYLN